MTSLQRDAESAGPGARATYIAPGARFEGEITGGTDVVVEGEVKGRVAPDSDVVVGEKGMVNGEISARTVRIHGRVIGNVRGRERLELMGTCSVEGDVAAPRMAIADGAFFKGNVEMVGAIPEPVAAAASASPAAAKAPPLVQNKPPAAPGPKPAGS